MKSETDRTSQQDLFFIQKVNTLALQSAECGFDPFAAILVKDGIIVADTIDKCIQYSDPTAHAELVLLSEYCRKHQLISLEAYTLYCNVEPCIMCSGAIHWSRLEKVVFSVPQARLQKVSSGKPKPGCGALINPGSEKIIVLGPLLEEAGYEVLKQYPFRSKKERHKDFYRGI